ncbi:MAG: acyl carrier protein, partial [Bryobacteraceae bacterium]
METFSEDLVRGEIRKLVAEVTERELDEIGDAASFRRELGIDSLTALEIMFAVDKKFKLSIPDDEYEQLKNLNDTVALVMK